MVGAKLRRSGWRKTKLKWLAQKKNGILAKN
jgi:hypothetical protein